MEAAEDSDSPKSAMIALLLAAELPPAPVPVPEPEQDVSVPPRSLDPESQATCYDLVLADRSPAVSAKDAMPLLRCCCWERERVSMPFLALPLPL